jgi:Mg-chelatase subunit ChlI
MDFSRKLDALQQHATDARSAAQSAVAESHDQLQQRIDQAQVDLNLAVKDAQQRASDATTDARSRWAMLQADVIAQTEDVQSRLNKRGARRCRRPPFPPPAVGRSMPESPPPTRTGQKPTPPTPSTMPRRL